jgi:putative NADPH-quinone reductase
MNICILMGSMKKNGNTATLVQPFIEQLRGKEVHVEYIWLYDKNIAPCKSCFVCQNTEGEPGCSIKDDMEQIYKSILDADCIVFATPIYSWFCTAPMKTVMDRLFTMNKFYGNTKTRYDLFEEAIKRLAKHSHLNYIGMLAVRDIDGISNFQTEKVIDQAKEFAENISIKSSLKSRSGI